METNAHKLELQRARRHRLRRIDYYPAEDAAAIVDKLRTPGIGGDASSILNRIVAEWAAAAHVQEGGIPEFQESYARAYATLNQNRMR